MFAHLHLSLMEFDKSGYETNEKHKDIQQFPMREKVHDY